MKVILQENVDGLGYLGDVLNVANGYARNYLLPRKIAVAADDRQVKLLQHVKRQTEQKAQKELEELGAVGKSLDGIALKFEVQTGKDDKLFGSVTSKDIAEQMAAQGHTVDRRKIQLAPTPQRVGNVHGSPETASGCGSQYQCDSGSKGEEEQAAPAEEAPEVLEPTIEEAETTE